MENEDDREEVIEGVGDPAREKTLAEPPGEEDPGLKGGGYDDEETDA